jgi:hypothetical protein
VYRSTGCSLKSGVASAMSYYNAKAPHFLHGLWRKWGLF